MDMLRELRHCRYMRVVHRGIPDLVVSDLAVEAYTRRGFTFRSTLYSHCSN
jgi:hypothetical protein